MNLKQLEFFLSELTESEQYHQAHPGRLSSRYERIEKSGSVIKSAKQRTAMSKNIGA